MYSGLKVNGVKLYKEATFPVKKFPDQKNVVKISNRYAKLLLFFTNIAKSISDSFIKADVATTLKNFNNVIL